MTEEQVTQTEGTTQTSSIKIYPKMAIYGFSFLFSPVFGGVLLRQNLVDIGNKKAGNIALLISIVFTALTLTAVTLIDKRTSSITFLINMLGGLFLSEFYFKKYFANTNYESKKIWKALIISIIIIIPFIWAALYSTPE